MFFFFSSRRRHTRCSRDWSSDVCSSDIMIRHTRCSRDWSSDVCSSDLVPLAVLGGAIRASTPFLFVSLGECLTEKSGRINLGLEGTLVMGAMSGYGIAYLTGWPWLGVVVAGSSGMALGALHGVVCSRPRVNDIAVGIALMLFGLGLAFYLGKPFIQPKAPRLPAIDLGWWSSSPQVRAALEVNVLFIVGAVLAPALLWALNNTRWGLAVQAVGDSADAARAMGYPVNRVRLLSTVTGGVFGGVGGSFLDPCDSRRA